MIAWRPSQVAELLGVSIGLIRRMIREGSLPCRRIGRAVVIRDEDLQAWLAKVGEATQRGARP